MSSLTDISSVLVGKNNELQKNAKRIYFVRHGHTETIEKVDSMNPSLSNLGIAQACSLAAFFKDKAIDEILTSELTRTIETANIIRGDRYIDVKAYKEFNELHTNGDWVDNAEINLSEIINSRTYKPDQIVRGGESLREFHRRVEYIWINTILNSNSKNILVVSHFEVMRVLISIIFGIKEGAEINYLIAFPHASISELRIINTADDMDLPNNMFALHNLCMTTHLKESLITY